MIDIEELSLEQFALLFPNEKNLARFEFEEDGTSISELLLYSLEIELKKWVAAHMKNKPNIKSILEIINEQSNIDDLIEKYKDKDIRDNYE